MFDLCFFLEGKKNPNTCSSKVKIRFFKTHELGIPDSKVKGMSKTFQL